MDTIPQILEDMSAQLDRLNKQRQELITKIRWMEQFTPESRMAGARMAELDRYARELTGYIERLRDVGYG